MGNVSNLPPLKSSSCLKTKILGDVPPYPPKLQTGSAMIFSFVLEVTGNRATLFECKILEVTGNRATGSQPFFFFVYSIIGNRVANVC